MKTAFYAAAALAALHVVDDSFLQPQPGTSASDHLSSGLIPLAGLAVAAVAYPRRSPGGQVALSIVVGGFAVLVGTEGWYDALRVGPSGDDYTGIASSAAGAVLLGITAVNLWRIRRLDERWVRRYLRRGLVTLGGLMVLLQVVYPLGVAYAGTHVAKPTPLATELGHAYEEVELVAHDGAVLRAWYIPSRNRAAVITYPGRQGAQRHAQFLARHGYGVLLVDRRGQGGSEGDPNSYGWGEHRDIGAAVAYLHARGDVDPGRIGGIGFSVGGEVLLESAARAPGLRAVVSEGAGFRSVREVTHILGSRWFTFPLVCFATLGTAVFGNRLPPPDLTDLVGRIGPRPVLLIKAEHGVGGEEINSIYHAAAGGTAELWQVPGSTHIGGLVAQPEEYERRVVGFFDRALLGTGQ